MDGKIYQFEDYLLDVSEQRLQKEGKAVPLPPKVFEVLRVLIERHGQLVTYQELMDEVWPETFVEESNLRYSIHTLRKTLSDSLIETVPKRGYRFKAPVESFTTEEFIRLHTGSFKKDDLMKSVAEPEPKKRGAFIKYLGMVALVCLFGGIGSYVYYFRSNRPEMTPDPKFLKTVAVMPFTVIGEKSERNAAIQTGLANSLSFNLRRIRALNVLPIGDALAGEDFDAPAAAGKLGADEVLTGTYRIEDDLVRVNFQVLRVSSGEIVHSKSFTVREENQVGVEDSISLQISRHFDLELVRLKDEARIKHLDLSDEARRNYLTAKRLPRESDVNRWQESTNLMKKVLDEHPNLALGYIGYAESLVFTHGSAIGCRDAPSVARRAIEIDPSVAEAYLVLGSCFRSDLDWKNAEEQYLKAIGLDPSLDRAYLEYGTMLDYQRRFAEAEIYLKKAVELEPFAPFYHVVLCEHYYYDMKYEEALKSCRQSLKIEPTHWQTEKKMHWIYAQQGRYDEIEKLRFGNLTKEEKLKNPEAKALIDGDIRKYWEINAKTRVLNENQRFSPLAVAGFYAKLEDKEKTLEALERATANPEDMLYRANPNPVYNFIRNDPRFVELMRKVNLEQ